MKQYLIKVDVADIHGMIDLEHMQKSVSNATYYSEDVTVAEQSLIMKFIEQLIKQRNANN